MSLPATNAADDPRDEIERLEAKIEDLAETIERCRKIILMARIAMVIGGAWLIAAMLGVVTFEPLGLICAITAILGGVVAFGSNTSTANQAIADMKTAEARRIELIDARDLKTVGAGEQARPTLH